MATAEDAEQALRSFRLWCAVTAGLAGLGGVLLSAPSASARPPAAALAVAERLAPGHPARVGARPVVPRSARKIGLEPPEATVHLEIGLKVRNQAALASFIAGMSDRASPLFHHFLRPGQFGARFGPTPGQVARVEAALRSVGLAPGPVDRDRLAIGVQASAATAERAFATSLVRYRLASGRVAYVNSAAPRIPAAATPYVSGVLGLDSLTVPSSLAIRPAAPHGRIRTTAVSPAARSRAAAARLAAAVRGPRPCAAATQAAQAYGSYTADQLAAHYGMSPLYGLSDLGQGVHVALAEFEPDSPSDVSAYFACYHLQATVNYVKVDGGAGSGPGSGEAAIDIEDVAGLAPAAIIDVYQAPKSGGTDTYDVYHAIIDAKKPDPVVSTSWGLCEPYSDPSLITMEHSLFEQAVAQGQTVLAAAGDSGSTDCYPAGGADAADLAVADPASQPYVVAVGGTSISPIGETAWNETGTGAGAGGGGPSSVWCMPSYQYRTGIPGLISQYSQPDASCTGAGQAPYQRQVPDVSADADPNSGYTIYYDGGWTAFGGTSAAAPLWAAVAALTDASPFCHAYGSGNAGVQPAGLYDLAGVASSYVYGDGEALGDVTADGNDYTPSGYTGGLYPATPGYDMATGLGTPLVSGYSAPGVASNFYPGLAALMCDLYATRNVSPSITRLSPSAGPVKGGTTITVTGTGFLPIRGADIAQMGSTIMAASCSTTTKCRITMPAHSAGTAAIRIDVEDLAISPAGSHSRYDYAAAPSISALSPHHGSPGGGTRVIIRGYGFIGRLVVRFGKKTARIVSHTATKIIVVAPGGSGTATVTVAAAGGTSVASAKSHYRY
jgi:subtilase family serine protease